MPRTGRDPSAWLAEARSELLGLAVEPAGWSYRRGSSPHAEPTTLACLALLASRSPGVEDPSAPLIARAADWLAASQNSDGSIGVAESTPTPGWMTPYAILLWKALGVREPETRRAVGWLLAMKGRTLDPREDPRHIAGHDTTLVGWPWVADTHSWLEPTALSVLALQLAGQVEHPRVIEGLRLIRNRAIDSGGWNYGNKAVFGRSLRPQPAPTGLALLTLAGIDRRTEIVARAVAYLESSLPAVRAPISLGWGLVGLRAWGADPAESDAWLADSYERLRGQPDAMPKLACLILGATEGALRWFGRSAGKGRTS